MCWEVFGRKPLKPITTQSFLWDLFVFLFFSHVLFLLFGDFGETFGGLLGGLWVSL